MSLAATQATRFVDLLTGLHEDEWERPTACAPWTVKDVAAHVLGWAEALTSPLEYLRQLRHARARRADFDGNSLDATNEVQVDARRHTPPDEIVDSLARIMPRFHALRRWSGPPLKAVPYREGFSGRWVTLGYVVDVVLTRDHFMHRSDICSAVGKSFFADDAEKSIVHDVVREWAHRARPDLRLELKGPTGGSFVAGSGEAGTVAADGIEFARAVAGRATEHLEIRGDRQHIEAWLEVRPTF
jgi:uncharacterized protein (TIGR03083 family)